MSRNSATALHGWPPRGICFAPRLGEYLARIEQQSLGSLLGHPAALGRGLRRATELLSLTVECLDVPAAWILHSAGWPATFGEHGMELGPAPATLRTPPETAGNGPLAAVREALRALPPMIAAPSTLVALPSPATLAQAAGAGVPISDAWGAGELCSPRTIAGGHGNPFRVPISNDWSRAVLQAFVRCLGEMDVLAGVMLDGDDGVSELSRMLDYYQLTAVCIRGPADLRPLPPGALAARALPIDGLTGPALATACIASDLLITTDGPVAAHVAPEELLRARRAVAAQ